jgi:hypothetical protein
MEAGFIRHPDGSYTTVGPDFDSVQPFGLAAGGLVTGMYGEGHAFVGDKMGHFTTFDAPGASGDGTRSRDITPDGAAVGYFESNSGLWRGFIRGTDGNFTIFDGPKAGTDGADETQGTFVWAVNVHGQLVGWTVDEDGGFHAYSRSSSGRFKSLHLPDQGKGKGRGSRAYCINKNGVIGGDYIDVNGVSHGFLLYRTGVVTLVDIHGAHHVQVSGVNDNGDATGFYSDKDSVQHGFVRSANGEIATFHAPDEGGTTGFGTFAQSINNNGVIAGYYWDSSGFTHGFVRTP